MNNRRKLLVALGAGALAAPLASFAQQPAKIPRIGFLGTISPQTNPHVTAGFLPGLRDLGFVEGKNINIEWRWTDGKNDRLPALVAELISLKVDVIVVSNGRAALAAKSATTSVPIVFVAISDPVAIGLVKSLAHPGGNVTGLSSLSSDLNRKRLELIKEIIPKLARVAVLHRPISPTAETSSLRNAQAAAKSLGVQLQVVKYRDSADLEAAFDSASKGRVGALIVLDETVAYLNSARIVQLGRKHNLPLAVPYQRMADLGGLMFYGIDENDSFRRVAVYVDKILKAANPADLPVEQPTKFELVVNLKTAKALGIKIPDVILLRADKVIE